MKMLVVILFGIVLTLIVYFTTIFSIEISYHIIGKFMTIKDSAEFGRTLWIYNSHILPYILLFASLVIILVKNKMFNTIVLSITYVGFVLWVWGGYIVSSWPYRTIPAFCLITSFYILNVTIIKFIVKRLLYVSVTIPEETDGETPAVPQEFAGKRGEVKQIIKGEPL